MIRIQLNQIGPHVAPSTWAGKITVIFPQKPIRMSLLQSAPPTRVIDYKIEEKLTAMPVHGIGQFTKLLHTSCTLVKDDERWINCCETPACIRTTKTAHASIGGWSRVDGEKMQNSTP